MKTVVPPVPTSRFELTAASRETAAARGDSTARAALPAPLDPAFLRRTYITCLWFSVAMSLCIQLFFEKPKFTWSFAAGALLGMLLLKGQELFVRRLLRPKDAPPYEGWDAGLPVYVVVALKYALVVAALAFIFRHQLINPVGMILGVSVVQFAIVGKITGRMLTGRMRSIGEVYVRKTTN